MVEFSVGMVVQLKSGGPPMTVQETWEDQSNCVWFSGQEVKNANFPNAALVLVEGKR